MATDPVLAALKDTQQRLASTRAENESLRHQLHRATIREERDLELINRLAGQLAQLEQPLTAA